LPGGSLEPSLAHYPLVRDSLNILLLCPGSSVRLLRGDKWTYRLELGGQCWEPLQLLTLQATQHPAKGRRPPSSPKPWTIYLLSPFPANYLNVVQQPTDKAHAPSTNTPYNNHTKFTQTQQQITQ